MSFAYIPLSFGTLILALSGCWRIMTLYCLWYTISHVQSLCKDIYRYVPAVREIFQWTGDKTIGTAASGTHDCVSALWKDVFSCQEWWHSDDDVGSFREWKASSKRKLELLKGKSVRGEKEWEKERVAGRAPNNYKNNTWFGKALPRSFNTSSG